MERCYDCGNAIPEGQVFRRTVAVSSSYTCGSISTNTRGSGKSFGDRNSTSGSYGGSTSTYTKVSLCPECNAEREAREAAARRALGCAVIAFLVAMAVVAIPLIVWAVLVDARKDKERLSAKEHMPLPPTAQAPKVTPKPIVKPPQPKEPDQVKEPEEPRPELPKEPPPPNPPRKPTPEKLPRPKVEPVPLTPEQLAKDRERSASILLRAARENLAGGSRARAEDILEEVCRKFPDTKAAEEARELLKKLDQE